jgi:hypothetical protein
VLVRFSLPGPPRKVRVHRRELAFDYGRHKVALHFERNGGVQVTNR